MNTTFGKFDKVRSEAKKQKEAAIEAAKNGDIELAKGALKTFPSFAKMASEIMNNVNDESLKAFIDTLQSYIKEISSKINEAGNKIDEISDNNKIGSDVNNETIPEKLSDSVTVFDVYEEVRRVLKAKGNEDVFMWHYGDYNNNVANLKDQLSRMVKEEGNKPGSAIKKVLEDTGIWNDIVKIAS